MRFASFVFVVLAGCGGSFILKQPVVNQCETQGLDGCDEITEGVLAYVDGDTAKGREKLLAGAAKNSPEKIQQFAAGLNALREIPGVGDKMGPVGEVAAILAGKPLPASAAKTIEPSSATSNGGASVITTTGGAKLIAETTSTDDQRKRACRDGTEGAGCIQVGSGGLVVTDVVFEGDCKGAFVGAFPRAAWTTSSARWVLRRQVGAGAWNVEPDEVFLIGGPEGTACDVSWAARTR